METTNMKKTILCAGLATLLLTAGCASGPDRVEEDFGNSVRAMREAQTYHPETRETIDITPVETTEGARMESALESYRSFSSDPSRTSREIDFSISD